MPKNKKLKQDAYGTLEVDNREKDIVEVWNFQKNETNVVQVLRENIPWLIEQLQTSLT